MAKREKDSTVGSVGQGMRGNPIGRKAEKPKDFRGTIAKLLVYMKPYRRGLICVLILNVLSSCFFIAGPKIMGKAIDTLYDGVKTRLSGGVGGGVDYDALFSILIFLIALYLLSALLEYLQQYMIVGISQNMMRQMRDDVNGKINHLSLSYLDGHTHGEILSRVTNDIDTINTTLGQSMSQALSSAVMLIGITVVMLTINPLLSLVAFVVLPLGFLITAFIAKRSQRFFAGQQKELGKINGVVEQMYGGHNIVKVFNYEQRSLDEFNTTNNRLYNHGWKAQFVTGVIYPVLNFVSNLAFVGVCVLGGYMVAIGRMTIGSIQAFVSYSRQFSQPIMQIASIVTLFQSTIAAAERVFELLDQTEELPDPATPVKIDNPKGSVCFDQIYFSYEPDKPLIENLSIEAKPGQLIAIVGPTGSGKTTLVNLLMRFYELNCGNIYIDGVNITDMRRKDLHRLFGMVLQDTWLFKGTISENIAYGKPHATQEEVVNAARIAFADPFIRTLAHGYDTIINEEGGNISQGQKQLLAIARAVISNPPIMILDEATSSVDTRTELLIQQAMARLMRDRTSFVIAHRLSTIREADNILVINHGRIVESGTHTELLAKGGFYTNLYDSQFNQPTLLN